ncbi:hypothetical protein BH23GEM9_BH23GEM9_13230 [soil metagenome]
MRAGLALIVLSLNVVAIAAILGARRGVGLKLGWIAAVVLLPVAGALGWFAVGRRNASERQHPGKSESSNGQ